ncbi:hypothetical protein A7J50_4409 [Pseudomonas antarctica]|uniref:Uncharacterized protein n=1 Tax=Pseudomonas antarctica TaxID=219572 RepID=A0A172Z5E7_9PSED|nr:hypothetical protein [Pseudomonas antarctica]ANF87763.1 hypothetical protein A7J50_4409 [Pseudomonas antarctica]
MNLDQQTHDYRSSMQHAAFTYLQRHEAEHLMDSDLLFDRCIRHLTLALEVPAFMAPKLVHNAWTELQVIKKRRWIGVDWASGKDSTRVHLVDVLAGQCFPIPARFLPQKLLDQRNTVQKPHPQ